MRTSTAAKKPSQSPIKPSERHRQQTIFDESHIPDRDFTPIENPEDDLYGKGHYGYNALRFAFNDNQSVRVANRTVEEFKKRMAEYDGPNDRPSWAATQPDGLVTTPSPPSANPLNTQTVSSPSRTPSKH